MPQSISTQRLQVKDTSRNFWSGLITLPFAIAVLVLGLAAILTGPVATSMKLKQSKEALPLRLPLAMLDEDSLGPYRLRQRNTLDSVVVEALGTDQYMNWTLEDTDLSPNDPLRNVILFVTYYTGGSNLVPHTPDVCYLGAGYSPGQPHENKLIDIRSLQSNVSQIPIRVCTFIKTAIFNNKPVTVIYTFMCNGKFVNTRTAVRLLINDLTDTYAYFCKVEVSFPRADRAQSIEGAKKIFESVLPVFIENHWPDFEAAEELASKSK